MIARNPDGTFVAYTDLGCYPIFHLCADAGILCAKCANSNSEVGTSNDTPSDWRIVASDINWEGLDLSCDHCNEPIKSAYADDCFSRLGCGADPMSSGGEEPMLKIIGRKVIVSKAGISAFNSTWPCSELRDTRAYWFEFDANGDLVDTDCPEQDDGSATVALSDDCKAYLFDDKQPEWL